METKKPVTLLTFVRRVMSFINEWDGRKNPTREELERIAQWFNESQDCCPEAVAIEIRQVFPNQTFMRNAVNGFC